MGREKVEKVRWRVRKLGGIWSVKGDREKVERRWWREKDFGEHDIVKKI